MAHSTTATSSYTLSKYSRSYPTSAQTYADWQHFTNPEIRLVLDVERSVNSELQGVRLRVLWHMKDCDSQQPQVVFASEDIDLLSFSLATDNSRQQQLPIKAVYRDNLVGIRYMHPRESVNASPTFRRFQVTFASAVIVTEFINTICSVCPCKFNPAGNANQYMDPPQIPCQTQPTASTVDRAISTSMSRTYAPTGSSLSSPQVPSSSQQERDYSQFTSSPVEQARPYHHSQELGRESRAPWTPVHGNRPIPAPQGSGLYFPDSQLSSQNVDVHRQSSTHISEENECDPKNTTSETAGALLSAVQETTQLYGLPSAALEQIVGRVVREEGFPKLLESLAKLWGVKSLVNVHMSK